MRSLQPSKEDIQHVNRWNFLTFFKFSGSFLPLLDPDLSGSRDATGSGSGSGSTRLVMLQEVVRIQSGSGSGSTRLISHTCCRRCLAPLPRSGGGVCRGSLLLLASTASQAATNMSSGFTCTIKAKILAQLQITTYKNSPDLIYHSLSIEMIISTLIGLQLTETLL